MQMSRKRGGAVEDDSTLFKVKSNVGRIREYKRILREIRTQMLVDWNSAYGTMRRLAMFWIYPTK